MDMETLEVMKERMKRLKERIALNKEMKNKGMVEILQGKADDLQKKIDNYTGD